MADIYEYYRQLTGDYDPDSGEDEFILFGVEVMTPSSSNVHSFRYRAEEDILLVGYKGRRRETSKSPGVFEYYRQLLGESGGPGIGYYEYSPVDEREARILYRIAAPGGHTNSQAGIGSGVWVWDELRQRGTLCGHQKSYRFVPELSTWTPRKPCQ